MTLLEIVQHVLSSIDGEPVNSISETEEAQQVAELVKGAYIALRSKVNTKQTQDLFELISSSDIARPVVMYVPDDVEEVLWIKYNKKESPDDINYQLLQFVPIEEFLRRSHSLDKTKSNVSYFDYVNESGDTIPILYYTDKHPEYYTTIDDNTILFDSIDLSYSSVLQNDDTLAYGQKISEFKMDDNWIVPFDDVGLSLLLEECKARAYVEILQTQNPKAENNLRIISAIQKASDPKVKGKHYGYGDGLPWYGRVPRR